MGDYEPIVSWRRRSAPLIVGFIVVFISLANQLVIPPLNRLVEANVCRDYYQEHDPSVISPGGDIEESLCKGKTVQTKVAELIGLITTLGVACELIVTLPLGYLSDRFGRRVILFWNIGAQTIAYCWILIVGYFYNTFSINLIVLSPLSYLLGGSTTVMSTNLFATIADVAENDVKRTALFSYIQAASQVTQLLAPIVAAATMRRNIYIPFWIGSAAFASALLATALLSDTRHDTTRNKLASTTGEAADPAEQEALLVLESDDRDQEHYENGNGNANKTCSGFMKATQDMMRITRIGFHNEYTDFKILFTSSRNTGLSLVAFLVTTLAKNSLNVLLQFVSKRYSLLISSSAYLFSVKAAVNLLLFIAIIPLSLKYLTTRMGVSIIDANIWGARLSVVLLALGSIAIGLSPTIWFLILSFIIYDLGWGFNLFMLSVLTHASFDILDETHIARLYSAVGFVETVGSLIGAPLLSSMWAIGINIGGFGLGLPFWICGILYSLVAIAIWKLQFPQTENGENDHVA